MKTSRLIRNILLAGSISLTLASCGGGGGGGGESSSSGNDSSTNTPNTQKGYAPYNLSGCTMTYNHDSRPYTFNFDSSGKVEGKAQLVDTIITYTGTYTYSRSADGQDATLELNTTSGKTSSGIEKTQTFDIELSFSSTTQASALVSYTNTDSVNDNGFHENEDVYRVTATFSGAGVQDNGSSDGESNDDISSDDNTQFTPDNIKGKSLSLGSSISYYFGNNGNFSALIINGSRSGLYQYKKTNDSEAKIKLIFDKHPIYGQYDTQKILASVWEFREVEIELKLGEKTKVTTFYSYTAGPAFNGGKLPESRVTEEEYKNVILN